MKKTILTTLTHAALSLCLLMPMTANIQAAQPSSSTGLRSAMTLQAPVTVTTDLEALETSQNAYGQLVPVEKYTEGTLLAIDHTGVARVLVDDQELNIRVSCLAITEEQKQAIAEEKEKELEERRKVEEARQKVAEAEQESQLAAAQNHYSDELEEEDLEIEVSNAYSWSGSVLTPSAGVNYGPSGRETYYNLPMDGVVSIMRSIGNNDAYWVREDGVKMLGSYVMVAAHLPTRPRGSLVPTSLGMGIVCDTGTFALSDHTQLDIAVAW